MDPKPASSLMNTDPKLSRHSRPGSSSQTPSSAPSPPTSSSSPVSHTPSSKKESAWAPTSSSSPVSSSADSKNGPVPQGDEKKSAVKRSVRDTRHGRHHRHHSPAAATQSTTKPAMATSVSTSSAPAVVQTPPSPKKDESPGKQTPSRSGISSVARMMSSLIRAQRQKIQGRLRTTTPKFVAVLAVFLILACALAVYYLYSHGMSGPSGSQASLADRVCVAAGCQEHASFFRRNLYSHADPCTDLDAHVCSHWALYSGLTSDLTRQMALAWTMRATESFIGDTTSDALQTEGTVAAEGKAISTFLRKCVAQKDDDPGSLRSIRELASALGIPWPYVVNDSAVKSTHPFEVLIRLDVFWGLQLWCQTTVLTHLREKTIPPMLLMRTTSAASIWLDMVNALDRDQGHVAYYQDINSLYGVPLPNESTMARHLDTEREVLNALTSIVNETRRQAVDTTVERVELAFTNLNDIRLTQLILYFFNASGIHKRSRVYIESRRFVVAVDEVLGRFSRDQIMEHLAWWFAQLCAMLASNQARMLIGGNEAQSQALKKAWCFNLAAAWFGPTVYSSISHFAVAEQRRSVTDFQQGLLAHVRLAVENISWSDEATRRAMMRRLSELRVYNWQDDVKPTPSQPQSSQAVVSEDWSNSTQRPYDGLSYAYLTNTLSVRQAATTSPLFYPDYGGKGVLRAASFGGLATAFLESALRTFDRRGIRTDEGQAWSWMSPRAERQLYRRLGCSNDIGENMLQVGSLRVAWEAYKNVSQSDSPLGGALDIVDWHGKTQRYTADQVFFLTYCRRFCSKGMSCNAAVRSLPDFGAVFGCAKQRSEEDDLSQCRFFA